MRRFFQKARCRRVSLPDPVAHLGPNIIAYDLVFLGRLNEVPAITTVPDIEALAGKPYAYDVDATDPNGDDLTYSLATAPAAMAIDPGTGQITWSPTADDVGSHAVTVRVEDGRGGFAEQRFTLSTIQPPPNRPPLFTSVPIVVASVNGLYQYEADATDADDDPLDYSLDSGPGGLTVDAATGRVQWTPTAAQLGEHQISLVVTDGRGGLSEQDFVIQVKSEPGNDPPVIVSEPVTTAEFGQTFMYNVDALDPDNDPLTYSLTTAPVSTTQAITTTCCPEP